MIANAAKPQHVWHRHWHHKAQESWGRRHLFFVLIKFSQLYPHDEVLDELKLIAADNDVTSYASYEVLGEWDLLVRLYLEPFRQPRLEEDLEERLQKYAYADQHWLKVKEIVRHWVWAKRGRQVGPPIDPESKYLQKAWPRSELSALNDLDGDVGNSRPKVARDYTGANLLTFAKHFGGMKLATAIQLRADPPSNREYKDIKRRLAEVLDQTGSWLRERSLYAFDRHDETNFLVMSRLTKDDEFKRIRFELLEPIGELVREMNARVTTYPIVSDELVCFADRLPPSVVRPPEVPFEDLVVGPEASEFEVKGSAFTPLDDTLKKGKIISPESTGFCVDTVCKELVGFLNTGGGNLLIGALETKEFGTVKALEEFPRTEAHIFCGIMDESYRSGSWDGWERKLRDTINAHIEPRPINAIEINRHMYGDEDIPVALVTVEMMEPDYYLVPAKKPKAYVIRDGTSSRIVETDEMERHKKRMRKEIQQRRRLAS